MVPRFPAHAAASLGAASLLLPIALAAQPHHPPPPQGERARVVVNDNRRPAGRLENGVLTLRLVARDGTWRPEGEKGEGLPVAAWAEEGGALLNPGPLIRVPEGTEIRATLRNALPGRTMTVHGLGERRAAPADTFRLSPGEVREVRFRAPGAGTYYYGATTGAKSFVFRDKEDSQLNGAIVVDPAGGATPPDRVFLISWWFEDADSTKTRREERGTMVINGRSWPHTERFHLAVGDTVRWRWINVTEAPHPMHLHGFYFRVDAKGDGARDTTYAPADRRLAVTERLGPGETMALTWGPERPGNWVFHCHFALHVSHHVRLGAPAAAPNSHAHEEPGSALKVPHGMAGLVLGIHVSPGRTARVARPAGEPRRLRLVVRSSAKPDGKTHAYTYALEDGGRYAATAAVDSLSLPGPTLVLERNQPVAITVVNRAHEPTAVHWHGIELESFPDGVPDWSGEPRRRMLQWLFPRPLLRPIAPGDSFVVRFTPPRAGTFMYHSHFNELEQIAGGLYGPIVVLDSGRRLDPATDHVLLLSADGPMRTSPILVNGRAESPPLELRAGATHRLRFINIFAVGGAPVALLDGDAPVRWRAVAKDGAELPPAQATERPARFRIVAGEIYDFEFTPEAAGTLRLRVGAGEGARIVPVVVR